MRKVTISQLMMIIKDTVREVSKLEREIKANKFKEVHKIPNCEDQVITEEYDVDANVIKLAEMYNTLASLKKAKKRANSTIKVDGTTSIEDAIVEVSEKRNLLSFYEGLAKETPKTTTRSSDGYNSQNYFYIVRETQYDVEEIKNKVIVLRDEINDLEALIDKANNNQTIEIE